MRVAAWLVLMMLVAASCTGAPQNPRGSGDREARLGTSSGGTQVVVPDIVHMDLKEGQRRLQRKGLQIALSEAVDSRRFRQVLAGTLDIDSGVWIAATDPSPGTRVPAGSRVMVTTLECPHQDCRFAAPPRLDCSNSEEQVAYSGQLAAPDRPGGPSTPEAALAKFLRSSKRLPGLKESDFERRDETARYTRLVSTRNGKTKVIATVREFGDSREVTGFQWCARR